MATSFKYLSNNDRVVSSTSLEESANIDPTFSGSNKDYFTQIYSGSASDVHVFDVSFGRSSELPLSGSSASSMKNIYNQMAKILLGHDSNGNILKFSLDENANQSDNLLHAAYFINFNRSQFQDKIKVGSFSMNVTVSGSAVVNLKDSGSNGYEVRECATGQYGLLYATGSNSNHIRITSSVNDIQGLIFYEAGVAVISPFIFAQTGSQPEPSGSYANFAQNTFGILSGSVTGSFSGSTSFVNVVTGSSINNAADGFYLKINSIDLQATTELNSTVYFCRAFNNEFNFSSNPTYLSDSEIVVKGGEPTNQPVSYITTVGLYDDKNQLLAVAKLSEPIKKTPDTELIARVRLDF